MKIMTRLVLSAVVCAGICSAHAQTYPAKPVRFIVPFPPGGPTDIMGRMAAQRLTEAWGVQVVADNRGGAGGNIGSELCAKSPPDGYTICMMTVAQSMSPGIYPRLPFDPLKDFAPVTLMATLPSLLMVHPSIPVKNVKELVALAKTKPGMLTYASTGNGTSPHMLMEMFKWMAGVNLVHVPYKGAAPAMIDQISGQIDVAFSTAIAALPFVQQGKVRALAISTQERFPPMPDLPTVEQGGVKGFDGSSWQGVVMPANTPREFVVKANAELAKMLKSPEMKEKILQQGGIASGNSPEEFAAFIKSETEKWGKVAKAAKVRIE
ncbi:MAG: tripartite tricarboxylate transporter substrate binding protein [Betaproteobacteria bacterium]|nr:tripartite tricarboxylate transporter substrate binding protein [Betaproteobacteria bacterium]